jgi:hypothetical protein
MPVRRTREGGYSDEFPTSRQLPEGFFDAYLDTNPTPGSPPTQPVPPTRMTARDVLRLHSSNQASITTDRGARLVLCMQDGPGSGLVRIFFCMGS